MTIRSGSPSPSMSLERVMASAAKLVSIRVCIEMLLVPLTNAAMSAGLSGLQTLSSWIFTPSMTCASRHSGGTPLLQKGSAAPISTFTVGGGVVTAPTHGEIDKRAQPSRDTRDCFCIKKPLKLNWKTRCHPYPNGLQIGVNRTLNCLFRAIEQAVD